MGCWHCRLHFNSLHHHASSIWNLSFPSSSNASKKSRQVGSIHPAPTAAKSSLLPALYMLASREARITGWRGTLSCDLYSRRRLPLCTEEPASCGAVTSGHPQCCRRGLPHPPEILLHNHQPTVGVIAILVSCEELSLLPKHIQGSGCHNGCSPPWVQHLLLTHTRRGNYSGAKSLSLGLHNACSISNPAGKAAGDSSLT